MFEVILTVDPVTVLGLSKMRYQFPAATWVVTFPEVTGPEVQEYELATPVVWSVGSRNSRDKSSRNYRYTPQPPDGGAP